MFSMLLATPIRGRALTRDALGCCPLPPLHDPLELMLQLGNPPPQFSVLGLQLSNPSVTRVIHDPRNLTENPKPRKINCLTVTHRLY
jgi:hypothetical protein